MPLQKQPQVEPPNNDSDLPWMNKSALRISTTCALIVSLVLAPLFFIEDLEVKRWKENFVMLGGWHFRIVIFLFVLERLSALTASPEITANIRFIIMCTGACALPALALSYVF
ncbi:hypothetical protein TrLO_g6662 [Triparma laevis f. longispina]|uniref:Uncharacterized protein n=1 Tax=Triparma laevis f. longispina TaxID=1714387 RepID=A0A9W7AAU9_9STRA|nr:hypothetical protein TrLO_g6662 [Triparma laevis f. longispina]